MEQWIRKILRDGPDCDREWDRGLCKKVKESKQQLYYCYYEIIIVIMRTKKAIFSYTLMATF